LLDSKSFKLLEYLTTHRLLQEKSV